MRKLLLLVAMLYSSSILADSSIEPKISQIESKVNTIDTKVTSIESKLHGMSKPKNVYKDDENVLSRDTDILVSVIGQGVSPTNTASPAQAYALAKRAATADAYRLIAEKVRGVRVDGQDLVKNMMVKKSTIRTSVKAMVRNANIVETTFKEGLCEVEMEIFLSYSDFAQ